MAVVVDSLGTGAVLPFYVVYYRDVAHVPVPHIGVLIALPLVLGALTAAPAGYATDRVGVGPVLALGSVLASSAQLVTASANSEIGFGIGLALLGLGMVGVNVATATLIGRTIPRPLRQPFFGIRFMAMNMCFAASGALVAFYVTLDHPGRFRQAFLADAVSWLLALTLFMIVLHSLTQPPTLLGTVRARGSELGAAAPSRGYLQLLRVSSTLPLVTLAFLLGLVGYPQLNVALPALARYEGASSTSIGVAFAVNGLVIVAGQLYVVVRLQVVRRTRALATTALLWGSVWALAGLLGVVHGAVMVTLVLALCTSVFAVGETLLQPTLPAITNDVADDSDRGRFNALTNGAETSSFVVGSLAAGLLIGAGLIPWLLISLIVLCAAAVIVAVRVLEPRLPHGSNGVVAAPTSSASVDLV
ncbi:MFS transporter [Terrabacter carboxydivorans]|uniref:MFS transporter n=1 Tax=Terrabacter carboxydivorans TaxID=619730 RepID=UPI0031D621AF